MLSAIMLSAHRTPLESMQRWEAATVSCSQPPALLSPRGPDSKLAGDP